MTGPATEARTVSDPRPGGDPDLRHLEDGLPVDASPVVIGWFPPLISAMKSSAIRGGRGRKTTPILLTGTKTKHGY